MIYFDSFQRGGGKKREKGIEKRKKKIGKKGIQRTHYLYKSNSPLSSLCLSFWKITAFNVEQSHFFFFTLFH